ncbi:MAG: hypothetical protein ABI986_08550 [Chloroflexota bacterium]
MRNIVNGISQRVTPDTSTSLSTSSTTAPVSRRLIATWAVACAFVIIPIGAALSPLGIRFAS